MKGENTKLKPVNCDWFACRDTWTLKSFTRYLWFVRRQTSDVRCQMSDVRCQMSNVWCLIWGVWLWCQTSDDGCLISDVWCQTSDVRCQTSDVWYQMSDVWCLMSDVWCQMSDVRCLMSDVRRLMFDVRCLVSDVRWLMPDVWYQTSDVRHLMSDIKHRSSPLRQGLDKLHMVPESSLYTWHRSCVKWLLRLDCQNSCTVLVWDKLQNSEYLGLEWSGYNKYRELIWKKN